MIQESISRQSISPLRRRMIEDMTLRNLAPRTQDAYLRAVKRFAAFLGLSPAQASAEDVRRFHLHLADSAMSIANVNRTMTGLGFVLRVTLKRPEIAAQIQFAREPNKLPLVLSPEEVAR